MKYNKKKNLKTSMQNAQKQRENESPEDPWSIQPSIPVGDAGWLRLGTSTSTSTAVSDAAADLQRI